MRDQAVSGIRRAYVYSVLLHGMLLLWMMNTWIQIQVPAPEFFEISLGSVSPARIEQILDNAASRTRQAITPEERIEVPERRMIDIEEPVISVPSESRLESRDIVPSATKLTTDVEAPQIDMSDQAQLLNMDRKENYQGSRITVGEQPGKGMETGVIGQAEAVNFTIEGEIAGRMLLVNPLPEYPEGLNRNATIRIQFAVLPDGSVSSAGMVPVRKENATLEELAMNSLRLWRFSPQPAGNEQIQRGTITFIFQIEQKQE